MPLAVGDRLGPYAITGTLGAGGMGEVYRARDSKLGRDVALKILPDAFAADPDRLARFQREAQVLAALNHSHIGAIYGLEDSGATHALVLELVEGETLADRIARGPVPVDEALPIARQIAEALEAAHEQGIIHRDLKPANIKVTPDGMVKVLDFGLAKLHAPNAPNGSNDPNAPTSRSLSPTITSPVMLTGIGTLLGTAAYMSPEQAKGRDADKRSDVWAFGCVLYEMLTGRGPFAGDDVSDTLANVLKREPDFSLLPADVPPAVHRLVQGCLVKDRRARIAGVSAALFVLDYPAGLAPTGTMAPAPHRSLWRRLPALAAGALAVSIVTGAAVWLATRPAVPPVVRTTIATSESTALSVSNSDRDLAITPDGSRVVYRGNNQLLVHALAQGQSTVLIAGGAPRGVFISPTGEWVGFFDGTALKKVRITGGPAETVSTVRGTPRGASWSPDGNTIVYATNATSGLQRVPAAGGESSPLTPDRQGGKGGGDHWWPEFLPGGKAVLFTRVQRSDIANPQIALLDLQTGKSRDLFSGGSHAHYVATGHLVYGAAGTLRAVAFDLGRLEVVGTAAPVLEGAMTTDFGAASFAVAANGSLVYVPGAAGGGGRALVSVDRHGRASPLPGLPLGSYREVRVSPLGTQLAYATRGEVWIYNLVRGIGSPLTTGSAQNRSPLWTTNGERIVFTSNRRGYLELFWRPADGTGSDELLLTRSRDLLDLRASGWSKDGTQLLFTEVSRSASINRCAIGQLAMARPADPHILIESDVCNDWGTVSPDGHWIAYGSNVSGQYQVYVERYPELGQRQQVSRGGGRHPRWSHDGRELFFWSQESGEMQTVRVQSGTTLVVEPPKGLFEFPMFVGPGVAPYDLLNDGGFVMIQTDQSEATGSGTSMILVQNWFNELKRLVPIN